MVKMDRLTSACVGYLTACALTVLPSFFGTGCTNTDNFEFRKKFREYDAIAGNVGGERKITLLVNEDNVTEGFLYATDKDQDGRFDTIKLRNLPKGHPLEAYARLDSLERAYDETVGAVEPGSWKK